MTDPFKVEEPATICFSGGRTSTYLLRRILDRHAGQLPPDVYVTFANTGAEREETLQFVNEVSKRWQVPVRWLEYRREPFDPMHYPPHPETGKIPIRSNSGLPTTVEVTYDSASRNAEPFWQLLRWVQAYRAYIKDADPLLPNPVNRFCTTQLKIKVQTRFMATLGHKHYEAYVGIRADEPRRVARAKARDDDETYPLALAGVTKDDVMAFWGWRRVGDSFEKFSEGPGFDLQLDPAGDLGNCTLCFMKSRGKIVSIMRHTTAHDAFWIEAEKFTGQTFRKDRSYTELRAQIEAGLPIKGVDEEAVGDCFCGTGD